MLFNSYTFLIFFAVVLFVARLSWSWTGKKAFLLVASYVFYAAWNPPFVILLWISTLGDWYFAKWMHAAGTTARRKLFLCASLALNLGLLGFFKYATFVVVNFASLMHTLGVDWNAAAPSIILPVGISFYTFQTLSYTFDVYRRQAAPWDSFLDYALYVTFFPQLVAGPIVRAVDFLPQCREPRRASGGQLGWGLSLLVIGLFCKVVVADRLMSGVADTVYAAGVIPDAASAWAGTLAFAVQILCDFSGYSTCAIGAALCLGFALPDNFRFPYAAVGFSDFWRRWHITLSTWLRDYLYIGLGGNRRGSFKTYRNLAVTMLLGGLWHGASWMFVIWGGLHGFYLIAERAAKRWIPNARFWSAPGGRLILAGLTFVAVCYTWVFFRARTLGTAFVQVKAMSGVSGASNFTLPALKMATVAVVTVVTLAVNWYLRERTLEHAFARMPQALRVALLALMMFLVAVSMAGEDHAFIYFQF